MTSTWSQDKFIKAFNFAANAHLRQCLPGSKLPYMVHVSIVCMEVMALQAAEPMDDPDLALQCAALHDVVEDTKVTVEKIREVFGQEIAHGVDALSKKKDPDFSLLDYFKKIKDQPKEIWIVKLADRITNLQPPPDFWTNEKIDDYRSESILIYDALKTASPYLAVRLYQKIESYG